MNLISGQCLICKQNEQVLKTTELRPFLKYIINTYFVNNKIGVKELKYRISPQSLCVVCACNVETSYKFKKMYEEKIAKESAIKKTLTCCLVCGFRGFGLVKTEDNPNEFQQNMCLFMETISKPRPYKQCAVCFVCVLELQNFNKIKTVLQQEMESSNNKIEQITLSEDEDLKIVPTRSTPKQQPSVQRKLRKRKRSESDSSQSKEEMPPAKLPKIHLSKRYFEKSPDIKSVSTLSKTKKINVPRTVSRDKKFYNSFPYIKMERITSVVIKSKDTTEKSKNDISKTASVGEDSISTNSSDYQKPKVSIRIKLISKKHTKACPKSKKNVNKCKECNQVFKTICQYKSHLLWHEKPASLKINLIRDPLISGMVVESEKVETKDVVEISVQVDEGIEEEEVSAVSQELVEETDSEDVPGVTSSSNINNSTEIDSVQEEVNNMTDENAEKGGQEEAKNCKETKDAGSDTNNSTPDGLESSFDKDEYVVVDELTEDNDKNDIGSQEKEKNHKDNSAHDDNGTDANLSQSENGTAEDKVEEDNEEKIREVEENDKQTDKENNTDEYCHKSSEETNEEYHDANDEINLSLIESDKSSEKSSSSNKNSNKDSSEEGSHVEQEESEELTENNQETQEKSSGDESHMDPEESEELTENNQELPEKSSDYTSEEDTDKTTALETALEKKLRMILGEDEKDPSESKESIWDEACVEKQIFDLTVISNTILKKTTNKSLDESPKTTKRVRFNVDNDCPEEEKLAQEVEMSGNVATVNE